MVSCRERRQERARTLDQLAAAGIPAPVVQENTCQPASLTQQLENSLILVRKAASVRHHLLFVEDDIDCHADFVTWLRIAEHDNVIVSFCAIKPQLEKHIKQPAGRPVTPGLYPLPRAVGYVGAQALFLPYRLLNALTEYAVGASDSLDMVLHYFARALGESISIAFPNPVQHRNPPKMRPVKNDRPLAGRLSRSYGRETDKPVQALLDARRSRWRERTAQPSSP